MKKPLYILFYITIALVLASVGLGSCNIMGENRPYTEYDSFVISPLRDYDENDVRWADYLFSHMANRVTNPTLVAYQEEPFVDGPVLNVYVSLDPDMPQEYSVQYGHDSVTLKAKRRASIFFLVYQFMSEVGRQDARFTISDLQPSMLGFIPDEGNYDFEYRGIYSVSNMNADQMMMIASQNVDSDWGIWGHNLAKVFPDGVLPEQARAKVKGVRTPEQICFSSVSLYKAIEEYICNNYGDDESDFARFLIMPNDNSLVCTCGACSDLGNDETNATPANAALVTRLANRFPQHQFFMGAYNSTTQAPTQPLPPNVGVMVSAIDLPMRHTPSANEQFSTLVHSWRAATQRIFVWDYTNNFDDYLSPYPVINLMAERLRYYKKLGVTGVFINGSAPIYSTFNIQNTFCQAALMVDVDTDPDSLSSRYLRHTYPVTHDIIDNYLRAQRHKVVDSDEGLPFYGGINDLVRVFLDPAEFEEFFDTLEAASKRTDGVERFHLNRILTAFSFTRLELLRLSERMYNPEEAARFIENLNNRDAIPNLVAYREADGEFEPYLEQWAHLPEIAPIFRDNPLKGLQIKVDKSKLDLDYNNPAVLTDGLCGFPTDYHTNWMINSQRELNLTLPPETARSGSTLVVSTMNAPKWRILTPSRIELWQAGRLISSATAEQGEPFTRTFFNLSLAGANASDPLAVKVFNRGRTFAIDEISVK